MSDEVRAEYSQGAAQYDSRWQSYVGQTQERTLRHLDQAVNAAAGTPVVPVLDVACGTGTLMLTLARKYPQVSVDGVDVTPAMLQQLESKLAHEPADVSQRVHAVVGPAESLSFPDASFDVVVTVNSFHYFPLPQDAIRDMLRVLRPGGVLIISDWCDDYWTCKACKLYLRLLRKPLSDVYGISDLRRMIENVDGTSVDLAERYRVGWIWGMMTIVARKAIAST